MNHMVNFALAHPIGPKTCRQLGIEEAEHPVGASLTMQYGQAMRLVSAGYVAGADPQDPASVQKALKPVKAKPAGSASA
ncbi:hypothetical protein SAMN05421505_12085 [Sinosporangium album]|uniref:Uncharacterized protein n=1 Tax=Sinosporangium album TaxID=504805 RepID=A0A1G8EFZ6_9ACTN|nr:hypothetical protein [Sinosporangium album]SDH68833.1 hypothetical protein SAMN05421505_12085 [Sinosporangium album]